MDICGMLFHFIGEDGLSHSVCCVLDPNHSSRNSQKHQSADGFTWVKNVFAAIKKPY